MTTPENETPEVETPEVEAEVVEAEVVDAPEADEAPEAVEADADAPVADADDADEAEVVEETSAPVVALSLNGAAHLAQTVGRRKEAVVRVRLVPGTGKFTLNGKTLEAYFPNKVHQQLIREPLVTTEKPETFDVIGNLHGGGITGQAGALRLAIARALIAIDAEDRPVLKKAGFLTRDPRVKERKKYGLKKARKAPQYSKR
ncbi:30S ribosomal protein S9 [Lentzea flaviverrucosa]|uniref:Small ribosomal subunit protein uS9 n=1 Tax=Lentzea flaviverrucosa TaxID=200379 RepID=A0A1H9XYH9_9PSEU|nr:30S ribosomal protein S9 [Lentzea flaviverrucosa]RDI30172.1 small subunit ribosomal protein S9 [Lentzea flaviverrucosa]SES51161.1 small subunit ribosomal protein S9 [Lentzea flaviverrucosa]